MKVFVADFELRNGDLSPKKTAIAFGAFDMSDARERFKAMCPDGFLAKLDIVHS
jgi:hypothetical protein